MADPTSAAPTSLPAPPTVGVPGYENGSQAGYMPAPLSIPPGNNMVPPINTTMSMNMPPGGKPGLMSPTSAGGKRAAPEPNKRALYVGGLDTRVTEDVLKQIFETTGHVQSVKIIPDKNVSSPLHVQKHVPA
jgi:nucleolysin TIA-1/TIAR